jgi:uncharacterized membrane protein
MSTTAKPARTVAVLAAVAVIVYAIVYHLNQSKYPESEGGELQ